MNRTHRPVLALTAALAILAGAFVVAPSSAGGPTARATLVEVVPFGAADQTAELVANASAVGSYLDGVARAEWEAGVARAEAERAAAARARSVAPAIPASLSTTPAGGHSDAWWGGVAICEQGGRNDPYFGFFSFMDGSSGGKPWEEQVAMGNALLARAGREVGPWAASCVAAGYAASPGG